MLATLSPGHLFQVYYRTPQAVQYQQKAIKRKNYHFSTTRPWTGEFQQLNTAGRRHKKVFLEPIANWSFFKGDRVEVLVGRDKGKQGIIKQVIAERNWVIVEGLNANYRKIGREKGFPGVYVLHEAPLLVTNEVALVDPSDLLQTEIDWRFLEDGSKVRVSKRTGREIPVPKESEETYDYKTRATYTDKPKDTAGSVVGEITFKPSLCTFEMDIMKQMGIVDERVPKKTYWY